MLPLKKATHAAAASASHPELSEKTACFRETTDRMVERKERFNLKCSNEQKEHTRA